MNHGAELGHVGDMSTSRPQRIRHIGTKICGVEPCYLGATTYNTELRVQK